MKNGSDSQLCFTEQGVAELVAELYRTYSSKWAMGLSEIEQLSISSLKANEIKDTKYNSVLHVRFKIIIVDLRYFVLAFWTCVMLLAANSKLLTYVIQNKI